MYNNLQQNPYYGQYQMYQQQQQMPQYGMNNCPNQAFLKGRPVSSLEEARASQIDLDGSVYLFPDIANKKIYTKQINADGTACFNVYTLNAEAPTAPEYVTKEEFLKTIEEIQKGITQKPSVSF